MFINGKFSPAKMPPRSQVRSILIGSRFCTTSRILVTYASGDEDYREKNGNMEMCFSASNSCVSQGDKVPPYACTRFDMSRVTGIGRVHVEKHIK